MNNFGGTTMIDIGEKEIGDLSAIFGVWNALSIISDVDAFKNHIMEHYNVHDFEKIFEGYKFFLQSAFNAFIYTIAYDYHLGIEEDFLFFRARFVGVELNKIPNCCDKVILLKNIFKEFKEIKRSKNYSQLSVAISKFKENVLDVFKGLFDNYVCISPKFKKSKEEILKKATMFYVYLYFNDLQDGPPKAYYMNSFDGKDRWELYEKYSFLKEKYFEGYKYALQFIWDHLLGSNSKLKDLHNTKDWLELDNFYDVIRDHVILPFEKESKIDFGLTQTMLLCGKIPKKSFKKLLSSLPESQLTTKEKLDVFFMWYPAEIVDPDKIFSGAPTFVSLLIGNAEIKKKYAEGEKVEIRKFIHPTERGNYYSYGILIESYGSISDYSGWVLFVSCCEDFSGFSASLYKMIEKYIMEYWMQDLINIQEMTINQEDLENYLVKDIEKYREKMRRIRLEKEKEVMLGDARGIIVELLTYLLLSEMGEKPKWITHLNGREVDIVVENDTSVRIIECKHNINNIKTRKENANNNDIEKLKEKAKLYNTSKKKFLEFWTWVRPNLELLEILKEENIRVVQISESEYLKDKKMDKLKKILGDVETNKIRKRNFYRPL